MRILFSISILLLAAGCQTTPTIERSINGTFEVKYDPALSSATQADYAADAECGERAEFISQRSRFDTMVFRRYSCDTSQPPHDE